MQTVDSSMCICHRLGDVTSQGDLDLLALADGRINYFRNEHGEFIQAESKSFYELVAVLTDRIPHMLESVFPVFPCSEF